jgi:hypothetical protein
MNTTRSSKVAVLFLALSVVVALIVTSGPSRRCQPAQTPGGSSAFGPNTKKNLVDEVAPCGASTLKSKELWM